MNGRSGRPSSPSLRRTPSQRPPCLEHGLATAPDGSCALCKRASVRPTPVEPPASPIGRFVTAVLGMAAIVCAGLAVCSLLGWVELDGLVPEWLRPAPPTEVTRERPTIEPAHAPLALAQKTQAQLTAEQLAHQIAQQQQQLTDIAAAASPEELERKLETVSRARDEVSVVMYSEGSCPSCVEARQYMTENRIAFTEHDIEASPSAREIQRRLNPKGSSPTIDVEGVVLVGFSGEGLEAMIDAAARKHVR